jgi:23S rRNA (adenine2503-C2)-methyltransferase
VTDDGPGDSPYLKSPEELIAFLPDAPGYRVDQLRDWLYRTPVLSAAEMTNLPSRVRDVLDAQLWPFDVEVDQSADRGTTRKWLFRAPDGGSIETVLMGYARRTTLCISSQVGCAMGCTFCATGQFGFDRHLEAGEITAQVAYANAFLRRSPIPDSPPRVTNVVFMGMGEPLANYGRVRESLRRIIDVMGMGARSVTVSTVGVVPGMLRLAEEPWQVGLAVSLHGADDEVRSRLVPLNERYPLEAVIAAAETYFDAKGRRVSIEWAMIDGANDDDDQARKLARIGRRLRAHVNLIALNPTPLSPDRPSGTHRIERFVQILRDAGVNTTVRETRGREIDAACGQLRLRRAGDGAPVA